MQRFTRWTTVVLAVCVLTLAGCEKKEPEKNPAEPADTTDTAAEGRPPGLLERTGAAADSSVEVTREKTAEAWDKTKETTGAVVDTTTEKTAEAWDKTKETTKKVYDKTTDATGKAVDKTRMVTGEGVKKVGEWIAPDDDKKK